MDLSHSTALPSRKLVTALILQRTSRCVYELKTNRYSSIKHNKVTTITKTKIKYNQCKLCLLYGIPFELQSLYKIVALIKPWPMIIKNVEIILQLFNNFLLIFDCLYTIWTQLQARYHQPNDVYIVLYKLCQSYVILHTYLLTYSMVQSPS